MNKQPVYYLQTDKRWKDKPYQTSEETNTIGNAGCGPSCASMLIETITGKTFTPEDACNWSMKHGYKATAQGTYYSYFVPQFKAFGIDCKRVNGINAYGKPSSPVHKEAFDLLKQGYYLIVLMGKGLWTSGGHFVVVWWVDDKVRINDSNSTKDARMNGDLNTFKSQAAYYWAIDARKYNGVTIETVAPKVKPIKDIQNGLNQKYKLGIKEDNAWGPESKRGLIRAIQQEINETRRIKIPVDGIWGTKTAAACPNIRRNNKGNIVWLLQVALYIKGYHVKLDGMFGSETLTAVKKFQKDKKIRIDGIVGKETWKSLVR